MRNGYGMWLVLVMGLVLLAGTAGCADSSSPLTREGLYAEAVPGGEEVEVLGLEEIDATAGDYLRDMANLMVSGTSKEEAVALERAEASIPDSEFQSDLRKRIIAWREELAEMRLTYKSAQSRACAERQVLGDDGRLYLCAREETALLINGDEVEEGMASAHVFVYEKAGGSWALVEDRQVEPTGLLPEDGYCERSFINEDGELETIIAEPAAFNEVR
ncbi:hypothetical protein AALA69_03470 [Eggerthellaceae bacterium 24-137]